MNSGKKNEQHHATYAKCIAVALGFAATSGLVALNASNFDLLGQVYAAGHESGQAGGGHSSGGRGGGHSGGSHGSSGGHSDHSDHSTDHAGHGGQGGKGRGGGSPSHEIPHGGGASTLEERVFRTGQGARTDHGGKPPWAGEDAMPEVELGRLNVGRAPDRVLQRALDEAYTTNLDKDADGVVDADAELDAIHSPLANLALYKESLVSDKWSLDQAASFLGRAADKNIPVNADTVRALSVILEIEEPNFAGFDYDRSGTYSAAELAGIFAGQAYTGSALEGFAQAADDARAVGLYYHDNPELAVEQGGP